MSEQRSKFAAWIAGLLFLSCSQATLSSRSANSDEEAVLRAEHQWVDAALKGDADAFSALMSDEYLALLTGARFRDKEAWVAGLRASTMTYKSVEITNVKVRLYGRTALVFGDYWRQIPRCLGQTPRAVAGGCQFLQQDTGALR